MYENIFNQNEAKEERRYNRKNNIWIGIIITILILSCWL